METSSLKHNKATQNRPDGARILDAPTLRLNIRDAIGTILSEKAWLEGDRNAITLLHSNTQRIVLVVIREGSELVHKAMEAALSVQLLRGRLWIETEEQSFSLDEEEIAAIQPRLHHYIFAEEESVFLLTFSGNNKGEF
ncbi:MAG: hypothetical protein ABI378_10120 [Chitinophagaceae bacterium]